MTNSDRSAPDITVVELQRHMPASIRKALPQALWNQEKLWALNITVKPIQIRELSYLLELPVWQLNGKRFQVKPIDVINDPHKYPDQYKRIIDSDMSHAIHVIKKNSRLTILDGFHRLAKAIISGNDVVQAKELSDDDLANISVPSKTL